MSEGTSFILKLEKCHNCHIDDHLVQSLENIFIFRVQRIRNKEVKYVTQDVNDLLEIFSRSIIVTVL